MRKGESSTKLSGLNPAGSSAGGGALSGAAVMTLAAYSYGGEVTVASAGVTAGMRVIPSLAAHLDADENHESMLAVASLVGVAGADSVTIRASFLEPTAGPVRFNFMAA